MTVDSRTGRPTRRAAAAGPGDRPPVRGGPVGAPVLAAGTRISNVRQISERVAMGRALWRELVIGFASQLGELRLGFTQLAALYVLADCGHDDDRRPGRGRSAARRRRRAGWSTGSSGGGSSSGGVEEEDRRQRTLQLTPRGAALLRVVDRARADQFLSAVRPMPTAERALIAMGVAALATHAISRRGRLIKTRPSDRCAPRDPRPPRADRRRTGWTRISRIEQEFRIEHRHTRRLAGRRSSRSAHDAAEHDAERSWLRSLGSAA